MMPAVTRRAILLATAGLAAPRLSTSIRAAAPIRIAAASDLQVVLPLITSAFERDTGVASRLTFGSTGNFASQIRQGAPFDVFLAADQRVVQDLARDGVITAVGPVYARGRLVVIARAGTAFAAAIREPPDPITGLAAAHDRGAAFRIAIANPEHAPYGQRAIETLGNRGVLDKLRPRLVYGENVSQAAQFVVTDAAAVGLVALSLTFAPALDGQVVAVPIAVDWHTPLDQGLAVLPKAGEAARRFADFMLGPFAQALLASHGFDLPGRA